MDNIDYDIDDNDVLLTDDQKLIKILNDRMCNIDPGRSGNKCGSAAIDKSIILINNTINMLISDINNIKFVFNSINDKVILNNVKYNDI